MLLQISEPNQSPNPHEHDYAIGIDLGTTHSLVSVVKSGKAQILPFAGGRLLPSVVHYGKDEVLVGYEATPYLDDTQNTIVSAKRFMGQAVSDIRFSHGYTLTGDDTSMPAFVTQAGAKSPVETSAHILNRIKTHTQNILSAQQLNAVITVPAYFDDAQRTATKEAARLAGLNVLRLLNEPTAAAIAYGLDESFTDGDTVLIYDLGGGTFDVSVLAKQSGVLEVLATGGNSSLGGDDIDRLLGNFLLTKAGIDPKTVAATEKSALARLARVVKESLSDTDSTVTAFNIAGHSYTITVTKTDIKNVAVPVINRTLQVIKQVLSDSKLTIEDLSDVILVGGSTKMPAIAEAVADFFGKSPLCTLNPDEVVALGAGELAHKLSKKQGGLLLLDVVPLSLGVETMGGLVEVIIPRNTPIPIKKRQTFTTHADYQTAMKIHVVQGEREMAELCRSLGRFELSIPPMRAGVARIEVTYFVDENGVLTVSARENTTNEISEIAITPSYGLSDEMQQSLLKAGFENAQTDKGLRMVIETKVKAEREILALKSALEEFGKLLDDTQTAQLTQKMADVERYLVLENDILLNNKSALEKAIAQLKLDSDYFASRIMNQSVRHSLAGTKTDQWLG